jgi:flagellar basal body rod protein FlgG
VDNITSIIASGMRSRAESLDLIANNLANSSTPAFKSEFERYALYGSEEALDANGGPDYTGLSPDLRKSWINFGQGILESTARPLDVALEGEGYFVTESPSGNLLTRNGSFQIGTDGQLRTREGFKVKLTLPDGQPLPPEFRLNPLQPIQIDKQGVIRQDNQPLARFDLVTSTSPQGLNKQGESYFALSDTASLKRAASVEVNQGMLEKSNVDPTTGTIALVKISRQFEMLQKALQLHGEMSRRSSEEVGRV